MQSDHFDASLLQRICDLRIAQQWIDLDIFLRKLEHIPAHLKNYINSVKGECLINLRRRDLGIEMLERSLSPDFIDGLIFLAGLNKAESLLNPEMNSLDQINLESFPMDCYRQILLLEGLLMKLSLELEQIALSEARVKTVLRRALQLAFLEVAHPGYPEHPFRSQVHKIRDFLLRQLSFFCFVTQDEQGILEYHEYLDFKGNPYALGILVMSLLKNNKVNLVNGEAYKRELRYLLLHKQHKQIFQDYLNQHLIKYWKEKYSGLVNSHVDEGGSTSLKKRRTIIEERVVAFEQPGRIVAWDYSEFLKARKKCIKTLLIEEMCALVPQFFQNPIHQQPIFESMQQAILWNPIIAKALLESHYQNQDYIECYYQVRHFLSFEPQSYDHKFYAEVLLFALKLCINHFRGKTKEALKYAGLLQTLRDKKTNLIGKNLHQNEIQYAVAIAYGSASRDESLKYNQRCEMREVAIRMLKKVVGRDQTGNMKYAFALALLLAEAGDTIQATKLIDTFKDLPLFNPRSLALRVLLLTCQNQNAQASKILLEESDEFKTTSLLRLLFCSLSFIEAWEAAQDAASIPSRGDTGPRNTSEESKGDISSQGSPQQIMLQNIGSFEDESKCSLVLVNYKISSQKQLTSSLRKSLKYFLGAFKSALSRNINKDWKYTMQDGRQVTLSEVVDALTILEYMGRALIELGLPSLLENVIMKIKELYPAYPHLPFLVRRVFDNQEYKYATFQKKMKRDEFLAMLDQIISRDPHNLELQRERIKLLNETGASTRALTLSLALREQHPNDPELLHELGKLHQNERNYEVAAELQLKALELSTQKAIIPFERIALILE